MVFPATSFSRSPELFTSGLHRKVGTSREPIQVWSQRIGRGRVGASDVWATAGNQSRRLEAHSRSVRVPERRLRKTTLRDGLTTPCTEVVSCV